MLDGLVEIVDEHDDAQRMLATHGEGGFVGDLALSGWIALATAVVRRNGELLQVRAGALRDAPGQRAGDVDPPSVSGITPRVCPANASASARRPRVK